MASGVSDSAIMPLLPDSVFPTLGAGVCNLRTRFGSSGWNQGCQYKKQPQPADDGCGAANLLRVLWSLFGLPANVGEVPFVGSPADPIHKGDRHGCLQLLELCVSPASIPAVW